MKVKLKDVGKLKYELITDSGEQYLSIYIDAPVRQYEVKSKLTENINYDLLVQKKLIKYVSSLKTRHKSVRLGHILHMISPDIRKELGIKTLHECGEVKKAYINALKTLTSVFEHVNLGRGMVYYNRNAVKNAKTILSRLEQDEPTNFERQFLAL